LNLILEAVNPDALDIDLLDRAVAHFAEVLGETHDDLDIVITGDFVRTIRDRTTSEPERETYTVDRLFGEAFARVMPKLGGGTVAVFNAGLVAQGTDEELALETFEHEAHHVAIFKRGEALNDLRLRKEANLKTAEATFVAIAGITAEEYRVASAVRGGRGAPSPTYRTSLDDGLDAFLDAVWKASEKRRWGGSVDDYCRTVMTAFSHLAVLLAYIAAEGEQEDEAEELSSHELWTDSIRSLWPRWVDGLGAIPDARQPAARSDLDARTNELVDVLRDLLQQIGFVLEDEEDGVLFDVV
jgi:hypothetical protein